MTNIYTKNNRRAHAVILMTIVGIASSFSFVLTALAAGIDPSDVIALANGARTKAGLVALHENAALTEAAKNKANDMLKNDYFAHTSPKGVEPWYWIKQAGYQYKAAGENLAINYTDAREQHDAWMKSETHRANILNVRYQDMGVAVVKGKIDGKESTVTVEMFGAPLYAVADEVAPVPPVAPVLADIKGVETEALQPVAQEPVRESDIALPDAREVIPIAPLRPVLAELTPDQMWLSLAWALVLSLCAVATPLLFISRAYSILLRKTEKSEVVMIKTGTLDLALTGEGIHKVKMA